MADDIQKLPASDMPTLEAGDDTLALPEDTSQENEESEENDGGDYAVLVGDSEESQSQVAQAEEFGEELTAIKNLVNRYAEQMEGIRNEIKVQRESLTNLMDNDEELSQLEEQAKTVTQDVKAKKQRVKESPEAMQIQMKLKELQEEVKEVQEALNNYLLRYYDMTRSKVIEDDEGNERTISISARLRGKKSE